MEQGYGLLKGKKGIVFGPMDETSIGWQIALAAHREGAVQAVSNVAIALRVGKPAELAKLLGNAPLISCDIIQSSLRSRRNLVGRPPPVNPLC